DFLRFCSYITAAAGIHASGLSRVVHALETKARPPVIWFHFQECTCCSESFIRSSHPIIADIILDKISLDYTELLQAAAGHQAEKSLHDTMEKYHGEYIMLVEGSIPTKDDGIYCTIGGRTSLDIVKEAAEGAKAIIAWGSCASNGCIQAADPNPTGATPIHEVISGKPIIKVPGCPPIAEVMAGVIVHILAFDRLPQLDGQGRPKAFYSKRVHDSCYRRPFYDAGLFVETFDDENAKKGYCLYKVGCRGPVTWNACGIIRWNDGVSYPIQSGHGCIGCSEANFWDNGPFYQHLASFPGFGIETTADTIGTIVGIGTVAGIVGHGIVTNIRKRRVIREEIDHSVPDDEIKPVEGGE
ncbi:MAG: hydrogenase small subunit, partial [Calditrichia bacterium]|nr:hydrogenase small subunit [Calditrichia bacterium]